MRPESFVLCLLYHLWFHPWFTQTVPFSLPNPPHYINHVPYLSSAFYLSPTDFADPIHCSAYWFSSALCLNSPATCSDPGLPPDGVLLIFYLHRPRVVITSTSPSDNIHCQILSWSLYLLRFSFFLFYRYCSFIKYMEGQKNHKRVEIFIEIARGHVQVSSQHDEQTRWRQTRRKKKIRKRWYTRKELKKPEPWHISFLLQYATAHVPFSYVYF